MFEKLKVPIRSPADPKGQPEETVNYQTIRLLASEVEAGRVRTVLFSFLFGLIGLISLALTYYTVTRIVPKLNEVRFVPVYVNVNEHGYVRVPPTLDQPFEITDRIREYFITQVIYDFESYYGAWDANLRLERLRHYIPIAKSKLYEDHAARVAKLGVELENRKRRVRVLVVEPLTTHENPNSLNQSRADIVVETDNASGQVEITHYSVTISYQFANYTDTEKRSPSESMLLKMRNNPAGMQVLEYYTERKLSPRISVERSP